MKRQSERHNCNPLERRVSCASRCLCVIATFTLVTGCPEDADVSTSNANTVAGFQQVHRLGGATLTIRANQDSVHVAEPLNISVELVAQEGTEPAIEFPHDELEACSVSRQEAQLGVPLDGKRRWTWKYTVECYVGGKHALPPIRVRLSQADVERKGEGGESEPDELVTDPITLQVESALSGEFNPVEFKDIKGAVSLEGPQHWWWLWWVGAGLVSLSLGGWLIYRMRRSSRAPLPESIQSPHDWAIEQLQRLQAEQLIDRGKVREFYFRLSEIVRIYIERALGFLAPEQTTQEFLRDIQNHHEFRLEHRLLLQEFLQSCDMVKFARYAPLSDEIDRALSSAYEYIRQTSRPAEMATEGRS